MKDFLEDWFDNVKQLALILGGAVLVLIWILISAYFTFDVLPLILNWLPFALMLTLQIGIVTVLCVAGVAAYYTMLDRCW